MIKVPIRKSLPIAVLLLSLILVVSPAEGNEVVSVGPSNRASVLFLSGALKAGHGTLSTPDGTTIPKTQHAAYAVDLGLGLRYGAFIFGISGEYSLWRQLTDPKRVSNVNSQGVMRGVYPLLGLEWGYLRVLWKVPLAVLGDYSFGNVGIGGKKATYEDPKTLSLQLHWRSTPFSFWGVEYQKVLFRNANIVGVDQSIPTTKSMDLKLISVMYGWNL